MILRYVLVGVGSGVLFGVMDGFIHGNRLARRLHEVFAPIARKSINIPAGFAVDLVYGFALAGGYLLLVGSLPGESGVLKGLVFGGLVWFARVVMQALSQWMMFTVPAKALAYTLATGLVEMLVLGVIYGLALPVTS